MSGTVTPKRGRTALAVIEIIVIRMQRCGDDVPGRGKLASGAAVAEVIAFRAVRNHDKMPVASLRCRAERDTHRERSKKLHVLRLVGRIPEPDGQRSAPEPQRALAKADRTDFGCRFNGRPRYFDQRSSSTRR